VGGAVYAVTIFLAEYQFMNFVFERWWLNFVDT
jgi:hypothetical protein